VCDRCLAVLSKRAAQFCRRTSARVCGGAACADLGGSSRNVFVLDEGFCCGGVRRLWTRKGADIRLCAAGEATQPRRMGDARARSSRVVWILGLGLPCSGGLLWIVMRRSRVDAWPCPGEKEGCTSYLYRIRCPLFVASAQSATAVREFGKIDL